MPLTSSSLGGRAGGRRALRTGERLEGEGLAPCKPEAVHVGTRTLIAMASSPRFIPPDSPHPHLPAGRLWWSELPTLLGWSPSTVVRRLRPALLDEQVAPSPDAVSKIQEENERRRVLRAEMAARLDLRRRPTRHPLTPWRYHVCAKAAMALAAELAAGEGPDELVTD